MNAVSGVSKKRGCSMVAEELGEMLAGEGKIFLSRINKRKGVTFDIGRREGIMSDVSRVVVLSRILIGLRTFFLFHREEGVMFGVGKERMLYPVLTGEGYYIWCWQGWVLDLVSVRGGYV